MTEEQNTTAEEQQSYVTTSTDQNVATVFDNETNKVKAFSRKQNPDGTYQTVDFTPENESVFLVFSNNMPETFYKNLMRNHQEPKFDLFAFPKKLCNHVREAFRHYQKNTTEDAVKLLYQYKVNKEGEFVCKLKTYGFREDELPWNQLAHIGLDRGTLEQSGNLRRLMAGDISQLISVDSADPMLRFKGDVKLRIESEKGKLKLDMRGPTFQKQLGLYGVNFSEQGLKELDTYGNLGTVHHTPYGDFLVSKDPDTRQVYHQRVEWAYVPEKLYGTKLTKEQYDALKEGKAAAVVVTGQNGKPKERNYQYNATFRRVLQQMTWQERQELFKDIKRMNDLDRIASRVPSEIGERNKGRRAATSNGSTPPEQSPSAAPRPEVKPTQTPQRGRGQHK